MDSIKGIGPAKALTLIRSHGNLESIFKALKAEGKYIVPEVDPDEIRQLFLKPEVLPASEVNLPLIPRSYLSKSFASSSSCHVLLTLFSASPFSCSL